jgi:phage anti-repressor protein
MKKNSIFIKLLKKHTDIDRDFIDTFFKKFKVGGELDFNIKDNDIINYLGITMRTLRNRLSNTYYKNELYIENIDYIKVKSVYTNKIIYMLNYQCFEKLAMSGDSKKSEEVREYFVKLREFLVENQKSIYQAMENKDDLKKYSTYESIYFFAVDERKKDIFKIGRTSDIINRLRNYNVGRIKEVELKYFAIVKNSLLIEKCMKHNLKNKIVFERKEIFHTKPEIIKKIIDDCYCKYVSKKENDDLYKELSDLLGLYSYTKDKVNIKPYIIIGNEL